MPELVGLSAQSPDIFGKLSELLKIRSQQQGLAGQAAEVQMTQQDARQRKALASYDWMKHVGDDGTVDVNSVVSDPELRNVAGDKWLDVITHAAQAKEGQLQAKRTLTALRGEQRSAFAEMLGALRSDKDVAEDNDKGRQKVTQAMIQYGEQYGDDVLPVLKAYAGPLQKAPKGHMSDALRTIQLQAHSAESQLSAQNPQYTSTGGKLTNVNPNAAAGADIPLTVGPSIRTDMSGAQYVHDPNTNTVTPVGGGPSPAAAPATPFRQPAYPGQAQDIANYQHEVAGTRAAADAAPANRNIFQHILKLADDTKTGPLISYLQNNSIGGQIFGDNYQELGKYLEKNAIANMQAMGGPPSDARLSAAVAANGSTKFNPKALKAVTQFNYATNTGLERYRQGLDKAIGLQDQDYTKLPQFKADWAKNFDIDAFRLENAIADGDKAQTAEVLQGLSPARRKEVAQKMKNLDSLAETGRLP